MTLSLIHIGFVDFSFDLASRKLVTSGTAWTLPPPAPGWRVMSCHVMSRVRGLLEARLTNGVGKLVT